MTGDEVTRLPLSRMRLGVLSAGMFLATLLVILFIIALPAGMRFELSPRNLLLWSGGSAFAVLSSYLAGIAAFTPHGLRLDADGMSGYYAPAPFRWSDIAEIDLVRSGKTMVIGLRLFKPEAYWHSLTPFQRIWRFGQPSPFHASIPTVPFALSDAELLALLRKYWWRYGEGAAVQAQDPT